MLAASDLLRDVRRSIRRSGLHVAMSECVRALPRTHLLNNRAHRLGWQRTRVSAQGPFGATRSAGYPDRGGDQPGRSDLSPMTHARHWSDPCQADQSHPRSQVSPPRMAVSYRRRTAVRKRVMPTSEPPPTIIPHLVTACAGWLCGAVSAQVHHRSSVASHVRRQQGKERDGPEHEQHKDSARADVPTIMWSATPIIRSCVSASPAH